MKKAVMLGAVVLLVASAAFGSQTLLKATKAVEAGKWVDIGVVDCSKVNKIRIQIGANFAESDVENLRAKYDVDLIAVESDEEFTFAYLADEWKGSNNIFELIPSKLKIRIKSKLPATFKIYVWG